MNRTRMIELQKARGEAEDLLQRLQWMSEVDVPFGLSDVVVSTRLRLQEIDQQIAQEAAQALPRS